MPEDKSGPGDDKSKPPDGDETNQLLVALRHPMRRQILKKMPSEGSISPSEISGLLGEPLSNVSYHVRVLADCSAIKLATTKPMRGSLQHFYAVAIDAEWARNALGLDPDR